MEVQDVLNSSSVVPSFIDASSLVAKRLNQVSDLVDVIRHGGRDHNPKTVMQRLPKHMRRRAMSHNIKRLPRVDREFAAKVLAKNTHRKKPPSRMHRRRPKNLIKEYTKRSNKENRWLQTHIWHAKRFEMIQLWGFRLPLRSYQRGVRPFMKAARDNAVIFDDSYCRMLRLRFTSIDQFETFKRNYSKMINSDYCSLKELRMSFSGIQQLFSFASLDRNAKIHDVILSVHPLFFEKPLKLFLELTGLTFKELSTNEIESKLKDEYSDELPIYAYESENCLVTDETNLYSTFTLYGSKVVQHLFKRLNLVKDDELNSSELKNTHDLWRNFCQLDGRANDLKNGTSFTLLVEDPRLSAIESTSYDEMKSENNSMTFEQLQSQLKESSILFNREKMHSYMAEKISEEKLNQLKSTRVGSVKIKQYKIPIIVSLWNWGSTQHFKLILPAGTTRDFFSYFYRCGFRVGSLSDRFILCNEISDCAYPFVWLPLTIDKPLYRWKRYKKLEETVFENFGKWDSFKNWSYLVDNPIYLAYLQSIIDSPNAQFDKNSELLKLNDVLVPVKIFVDGSNNVSDDTLIYEWSNSEKINEMELTTNGAEDLNDDYDPDKFFDSTDSEDENMEVDERKPARFYQERRIHTKVHDEDKVIIGRIAIAEQSHYHGKVEALGYIELKSFLNLRNSSGRVRVRNSNSPRLLNARVKTLYS